MLASIGADRAVEIDYSLFMARGVRYRDLSVGEMCTVVYGWAVGKMGAEARRKFDHDLSPDELVAITDESVPEELRGVRPPSWWHG